MPTGKVVVGVNGVKGSMGCGTGGVGLWLESDVFGARRGKEEGQREREFAPLFAQKNFGLGRFRAGRSQQQKRPSHPETRPRPPSCHFVSFCVIFPPFLLFSTNLGNSEPRALCVQWVCRVDSKSKNRKIFGPNEKTRFYTNSYNDLLVTIISLVFLGVLYIFLFFS